MFHLVSQAALGSWVLCLIFRVLFLNLENTFSLLNLRRIKEQKNRHTHDIETD